MVDFFLLHTFNPFYQGYRYISSYANSVGPDQRTPVKSKLKQHSLKAGQFIESFCIERTKKMCHTLIQLWSIFCQSINLFFHLSFRSNLYQYRSLFSYRPFQYCTLHHPKFWIWGLFLAILLWNSKLSFSKQCRPW